MHLPPVPRFLVRALLRTFVVLLFVGVPAAVYYLQEYGVGFGLRDQVAKALSGETFQTSIGKLSLNPFQGLVAQQIRVTETQGDKKNLAYIERLVVSISFRDLLRRKISIDQISLDDSEVSIPLAEGTKAPRLNLGRVTGQCMFLPGQVRINHFEANLEGIRVVVTGILRNPERFRADSPAAPRAQPELPSERSEVLLNILNKVAECRFPGMAPEVRLEIDGDLADLSTLTLQPIIVRSGPIVAPTWEVNGLEAKASYEGGSVTLTQFLVQGRDGGTLNASARWMSEDKSLKFEVSSTLMLEPFQDLFAKQSPLQKLKFHEPPQLEIFGRADFSAPTMRYQATGSLRLGKSSWEKVTFDSLAADFVGRDGTFFVRDLRAVANEGALKADVYFAPDDFRLRLTSSIPPTDFLSVVGPNERIVLKEMEFKDLPHVELELWGPRPDLAVLTGTGTLRLGRTAMRGSWLDWAKSDLIIGDRAVTYSNFSLGLGELKGSGSFVYDFGRQEVVLRDIFSTMPPGAVMMWIDPNISEIIKSYRFRQPPTVRGAGVVHMKDPKKNDLSLKIDAAKGLDYDLLKRTLEFGSTQADLHIKGTQLLVTVKNAELMGGDVALKATVSIDPKDPTFGADIDIQRVNFAKLTKLYFDYDDSKGIGSGNFQFKARFGEEEKMRGSGSLRVEDGRVFAIPILGPLSTIINKIIPGTGLHTAKLATADFQVENEKIITKNLAIQGAGFNMLGYGDIFFTEDRMDMSVRINARGLTGVVLFPVSKLFEYESTGSLSEPEWRPKLVPRFGNGE
jgi:hypothetical protein